MRTRLRSTSLWGATFYAASGEREFIDFWAHDRDQERRAFADFIDWVYARWSADPTMHIYHYAAYEVSAVRRLMGRYATGVDFPGDSRPSYTTIF